MAFQALCKQRNIGEGESAPFKLGNREVILLWPDGDKPRAFQGKCPHEGMSLHQSDFNGRILICTVHGWVFDGRSGKGLSPTGCKLDEYALRIEDGVIEVDLEQVLEQ